MRTIAMLGALMLALVLSGCGGHQRALSKGQIKNIWEQVSDKGYIRVRGVGAAPDSATTQTKRRGLARNAALVAARYEALALVKGVRVTGGLTIKDLEEKDSEIREVAERIVNGFEEVQTEWTEDDGAVVLLELRRSELKRILRESRAYDPAPGRRASRTLPGVR